MAFASTGKERSLVERVDHGFKIRTEIRAHVSSDFSLASSTRAFKRRTNIETFELTTRSIIHRGCWVVATPPS